MAKDEKTTGVLIDDEELGGVAGGVTLSPDLSQSDLEQLRDALKSGDFGVPQNTNTINTGSLTRPAGSPGTIEPLDNAATQAAEEFRQGTNLGNMLGRY